MRYLMVFVVIALLLSACGSGLKSPNDEFKAVKKGDNYRVENEDGDEIFTTHPQYTTPNDAKGGCFSPDSSMFAAVYHYGHAGHYSWFGVWSTETGEFLYEAQKSGWTTDCSGIF